MHLHAQVTSKLLLYKYVHSCRCTDKQALVQAQSPPVHIYSQTHKVNSVGKQMAKHCVSDYSSADTQEHSQLAQ